MALFDWLRRAKPALHTLYTTRQLLNLFELSDSIPCQRCRYDLKGLPPNSKCPKCGAQTLASKLFHLSAGTGYSIDVFLFFIDATRQPKVEVPAAAKLMH